MTKTQTAAILALRSKLDPTHPGHRGDEMVQKHLTALRPYLDSWVAPLIDALEPRAPRHIQEYARRSGAYVRKQMQVVK